MGKLVERVSFHLAAALLHKVPTHQPDLLLSPQVWCLQPAERCPERSRQNQRGQGQRLVFRWNVPGACPGIAPAHPALCCNQGDEAANICSPAFCWKLTSRTSAWRILQLRCWHRCCSRASHSFGTENSWLKLWAYFKFKDSSTRFLNFLHALDDAGWIFLNLSTGCLLKTNCFMSVSERAEELKEGNMFFSLLFFSCKQ